MAQPNTFIPSEKPINAIQIFLDLTQDLCLEMSLTPEKCRDKSISQEVFEIGNNSDTTEEDICNEQNYLTQKQNQIKNLLNSFKNHVTGIKDKNLMDKYCQLYSSNGINYSNLKKIVSKRIREKNTRWNMKLKSLLKSNHLSQIFYHYLENESMNWLNKSKVKERDSIIELIERLIQYQHNDQILNEIKTYKK